jgi:hypothetical protein
MPISTLNMPNKELKITENQPLPVSNSRGEIASFQPSEVEAGYNRLRTEFQTRSRGSGKTSAPRAEAPDAHEHGSAR